MVLQATPNCEATPKPDDRLGLLAVREAVASLPPEPKGGAGAALPTRTEHGRNSKPD